MIAMSDACSISGWGPLTVVESTGDDARAEGVLRIRADCAYLESDDGPSLLVWPADRTTWNAVDNSLSFTSESGTMTLSDGKQVVLAGSWFGADRDGEIDWIAAPHAECPAVINRWQVSDVSAAD